MRSSSPWVRLALVVLVPALGYGAYLGVLHVCGAYHYRAAAAAAERREFAEARTHVKQCEDIWPDDAALRLLAARIAWRAGDFDDALAQLRAHELKKGDMHANAFERRLLQIRQGDLRDADAMLAQCVGSPEAADTPVILEAYIAGSLEVLIAAMHQGQTTLGGSAEPQVVRTHTAVDLWLRTRLARADQVQGLVWRGHLHVIGNQNAKAVADLRHALELDPDHFEARLYLAKFLQSDLPSEAATHFELLRRRFPKNWDVLYQTAVNERTLGRFDEARVILDGMLVDDPGSAEVLAERGQLALDMRKPEEAEDFLRRTLAQTPHDARIHRALIACLRMSGKDLQAEQHEAFMRQVEDMRREQEEKTKKGSPGPKK